MNIFYPRQAVGRSIGDLVDSRKTSGAVLLSVQNQGLMPKEVQRSLSRRTFITKDAGRGFGSCSVKLLTEQYLQGSAGFVSDKEHQSIFQVRLPWTINL